MATTRSDEYTAEYKLAKIHYCGLSNSHVISHLAIEEYLNFFLIVEEL